MYMQEIRDMAKALGLKTGAMTKVELVRSIHRAEGNFDCFATDVEGLCDQPGCLWREDCRRASKKSAS